MMTKGLEKELEGKKKLYFNFDILEFLDCYALFSFRFIIVNFISSINSNISCYKYVTLNKHLVQNDEQIL